MARRKTKVTLISLIIILLGLLYTSLTTPKTTPVPVTAPQIITHQVKKVIDGDTLELATGQKVRLIGIDTPETVDPRRKVECYGKEASSFLKGQIEGKEIRLEKDITETDKYGRLLRYAWIGDIFINEHLVRQGFANASAYPPDIKYQQLFKSAETLAREQKVGLWGDICSNK